VIAWEQLEQILAALASANDIDDSAAARELLLLTIEGYKPQCELNDWLRQPHSLP
jgi:hypothetical protein